MPFTMPDFRPLKEEEVNPFANLITKALSGYQDSLQAQYARPTLEQNLQKLMLANSLSKQQQEWNPKIWQSEIGLRGAERNKLNTMTPLEEKELQLKNQFYPDLTRAQIENFKSLSNLRNLGGGSGGLGVGQKEIAGLQRQLMIDHPDWDSNTANKAASSYLSLSDKFPDGTKLPELSGLAKALIAQIQKRNSSTAIQNQAANMSVLASDINEIDSTPLTKFQQFPGRLDYAKYKAQMALGHDVPQEFRDYEAFKDITSNFAMDALRKGFGTSVVPPYVYATLGKASNPSSVWWHDPKLVQQEWEKTKKWINNNAEKYKKLSTQGISANISNELDKSRENEKNEEVKTIWTRNSSGKLVRE